MNTPAEFAANLAEVREKIAAACKRASRQPEEITLIAVTKMHPPAAMAVAADAGITHIGENKVQEFESKQAEWTPLREAHGMRAHLIGHLQSNKAAKAAALFDSVDSLDSLRLAERLNKAAAALGRVLPVLIEVKLSEEDAKAGLEPEGPELAQLLERLPDLASLGLRGLMTVPPYLRDAEAVRPYFQRLRVLRDAFAQQHPRLHFNTLSMGMTHDYAVAIEEGATEIRLGTALFGARDYSRA